MITTLLLATLGVVLTLILLIWFQNRSTRRKMINKIPGPYCYPVIGNLLHLMGSSENLWKYFRFLGQEYYPIYRMWNGHIGSVGLLSPPDIEILLTSKKHLRKTKIYEWLQPWLGTGLLTSAGTKWHSRRKILTPAFHFNILQEFLGIFLEQSDFLVQRLQDECSKPYTNVIPIITQFTLHSICETAMGTRLDESKRQAKEYVQSIYRMGQLILHRITRPWLFFPFIYFFMPESREQKKVVQILHKFTMSVIEERNKSFKESDVVQKPSDESFRTKKRLAMLDLLISAKNNGTPISDEGIREEVDTFMFEGHDTTTASICFTLMILANNLDVQDKILQELSEVLQDSNRQLTFQDLQKLRYLEQVIKESLRLYPSVPTIARVTDEDIQTSTGYVIPANTYVHIHIYDLHHNPELYREPNKFDPDRFSPENSQGRHPFAYLPFSAGPRNCIGQRFAMLEIKSAIAAVIRNFILKPIDTPSDMNMIAHLVLKNKDAIRVKFELRK